VPLSDPFLYYPSFSIQCSKPRTGEPIFPHGTCMINVWTCNLYEELALRGVTIWSSLLYDETRILILAQTLQWKFSEWRSLCHPQVLSSRCFKKGLPWCK
jgi:hypothetical protein